MAAWRRKAQVLFPELRRELNGPPEYSIYELFFDLLPMVWEAHGMDDIEKLKAIYGYAEWCSNQRTKMLWNAAAVAFWEHILDKPQFLQDVIPWLSPGIIANEWSLWEYRCTHETLRQVEVMIEKRRKFLYRKNVYHTGITRKI